jgi:hypothetical protein
MSDKNDEIMPVGIQNPLESLGIEPWTIKSLARENQLPFIRDLSKLLARYHHPDRYANQSPDVRNKHARFMAKVNAAVTTLSDSWTRAEALQEFNSTQDPRVALELRVKALQQELEAERAKQKPAPIQVDPQSIIESTQTVFARLREYQRYAITYRQVLNKQLFGQVVFKTVTSIPQDKWNKNVKGSTRKPIAQFINEYIDTTNEFTGKLTEMKIHTNSAKYELLGSILYETFEYVPNLDQFRKRVEANTARSDEPFCDLYMRKNGQFIAPVVENDELGVIVLKKMGGIPEFIVAALDKKSELGYKQERVKQKK